MTAFIFSLLFISYVLIPGIIVRRLFSLFVPLRKLQWTRSEEVTSSVIVCLIPFAIAILSVKYCYWFGHHPLPFDDSLLQKWSDYKNVFSASYSDSFYLNNRDVVWDAAGRIIMRQCRLIIWFYLATAVVTIIMGTTTYYYGNLRRFTAVEWGITKFVIPSISEWYAMLRPFTFPRSPERKVVVDVLTTNDKLYQGEVGDYHVDTNNHLTGILIKGVRRFDRDGYKRDKTEKMATPTENYWRTIPGDTLYMLADKILNLNISYVPAERLDALAEKNLRKLKIDARVTIEAPIAPATQTTAERIATESSEEKNFLICPHCKAHGLQRRIVRATEQTPLISRSDGNNYHLFLQYGPGRRILRKGAASKEEFITHFRYALEAEGVANDPVVVVLKAKGENIMNLRNVIEEVADGLASKLEEGERLAPFYNYQNKKLTELVRKK